jgi:hypothetical protein
MGKWLIGVIGFVLVAGSCLYLRLWISDLDVSAPHTTLHMGETVQLVVTRKTWLGTEPLAHPERTKYFTTWETMTPVDPDGKVTGIGTWGETHESSVVMAYNGKLRGSVNLSVRADGSGPTLDFVVDAPPVVGERATTCCSTPVELIEGQQTAFRLLRKDSPHSDLTSRATGTRYTLFFGSGVPNDANSAQIVGYGEGINPATFRVDDEHGMITAPASIGKLNAFHILVLARNGEEVGWKEIKLVHATVSPQP